jgi:hypothetical protein
MTQCRYTTILTASVTPHPTLVDSGRASAGDRIADYKTGVSFWLNLAEPRIERVIFIENTGHDLSGLESFAKANNRFGREIEFISLNRNDIPRGLHYGYAEFKLIVEGLRVSRLYRHARGVIKATGRYIFPQLTRLLNRLPPTFRVAVDARRNSFLTPKPYRFVTTPLILASKEGFETFIRTAYQGMAPAPAEWRAFVEEVLYTRLIVHEDADDIILRWPVNCDPAGFGRKGNRRLRSPRRRLLSTARGLGRIILPSWWL